MRIGQNEILAALTPREPWLYRHQRLVSIAISIAVNAAIFYAVLAKWAAAFGWMYGGAR